MFDAQDPQTNRLFRQQADGTFLDTPIVDGSNQNLARGAAFGDLNNDGFPDVVAATVFDRQERFAPARIYINQLEEVNRWLKVKLEGTESNRDGFGAKIEVYTGDKLMIRELNGGSSYLSQNSSAVHFGLGSVSNIDSLTISWPNGAKETYYDVQPNQYLKAVEKQGITPAQVVPADLVTGFSKDTEKELNLFPNPFKESITVLSGDETLTRPEFQLFDISGRELSAIFKVETTSLNTVKIYFDPAMPQGIYFLQIITSRPYIKKVIKY